MSNDDGATILPYGGRRTPPNSGYAGSETSRERAVRDDTTGVTSARQRTVLAHLARYGVHGVTYFELGQRLNMHHGQASGVLSNLHKAGLIARLTVKRHRCKVYVLPEFVQGRDTEPAGRVAKPGLGPIADQMAQVLEAIQRQGHITGEDRVRIEAVTTEYRRIVR